MTTTEYGYLTDESDPHGSHRGEIRGLLDGGQPAVYELPNGGYAPWLYQPTPDAPDGRWLRPTASAALSPQPPGPPAQLQPACSCGWRLNLRTRRDNPLYDQPRSLALAEQAWRLHVAANTAAGLTPHDHAAVSAVRTRLDAILTTRPRIALALLRDLENVLHLGERAAVTTARMHGIPWDQIADDRGTPRGTLQGRYPAHTLTDPFAENGALTLLQDAADATPEAARENGAVPDPRPDPQHEHLVPVPHQNPQQPPDRANTQAP